MKLSIPTAANRSFDIDVGHGEMLFVVGSNGSGKSALLNYLHQRRDLPSTLIRAHRQTWLDSATVNLTLRAVEQMGTQLVLSEGLPNARHKDPHAQYRVQSALFRLDQAERRLEHAVTGSVEAGDRPGPDDPRLRELPIRRINRLFEKAGLNVTLENQSGHFFANRGRTPFDVDAMSDGERAAFLISAEVLTAPAGQLLLFDEPERHLHRSIASTFLSSLFALRPDCHFVIATHDLDLVLDSQSACVLALQSCSFEGPHGGPWGCTLIEPGGAVPEEVRREILGARRSVLFVEGNGASLDKPLYTTLFPEATVIGCENCVEIEKRVKGLRATRDKHWVNACGIVDRDFRTDEQVSALAQHGIYALDAYSVECLYYQTDFQAAAGGTAGAGH